MPSTDPDPDSISGRPPSVLFLCVGNSCRSQMAEALARRAHGRRIEVASAGIAPKGVDPRAAAALDRAGVSTAGLTSKGLETLGDQTFDLVVTLCPEARDLAAPARHRVHLPFDDPPALVGEPEGLAAFDRVCGEIDAMVERLPEYLALP